MVKLRSMVLDGSRWCLVGGKSEFEQFCKVPFEEGVASLR